MSVDVEHRRILANALLGFLRGHVRSRAFDLSVMRCMEKGGADRAVAEICGETYALYDDFRDETFDAPDEARLALERAVRFLRTDLEYAWGPMGEIDRRDIETVWPFRDAEGLRAHQSAEAGDEFTPAMLVREKPVLRATAEAFAVLLVSIAVFALAAFIVTRWL